MNFKSEEKKEQALLRSPWTFDNRPFIVKSCSPEEEYTCRSFHSLPVWIRLPGIKAHLSNPKILSRLCSRLDKPIYIDVVMAARSSYSFARVCLKVFADREMLDDVVYEDPFGNTYRQRVKCEWRHVRCVNCLNLGHLQEKCSECRKTFYSDECKGSCRT